MPPKALVDHVGYHFNVDEAKNKNLVFKLGRSTGPTTGVRHLPRTFIHEYDAEGRVTVSSTEQAIMSLKPNSFFAVHGDSGALAYNPDGDPTGMIWGFPECRGGGVDLSCTFYTPFGSIMSSLTKAFAVVLGEDTFSLEYTP